ncbi:MAG TPA: type 4a pilus biogenesis protein PilO [Phycisphaerae bacterium]|nr:type 4a pilus biogenesis protein PilO [Phycisphaerae bacterium]
MNNASAAVKQWAPALAAMATVIAAVVFAISSTSEVSQEISHMDELASTLSSTAGDVQRAVRSPQQIDELAAKRMDLQRRMTDSQKPGLVVTQLSEAARSAGLQVVEIQPLADTVNPAASAVVYPNYRVSLKGGYQQIAKYLANCTQQRIPVRVTSLEMGRLDENSPATNGDELRADIVVEAFQAKSGTTLENPAAS